MERGHIQGLPKFFEYPLLSQERIKPFKILGENGTWAYPGTVQIF